MHKAGRPLSLCYNEIEGDRRLGLKTKLNALICNKKGGKSSIQWNKQEAEEKQHKLTISIISEFILAIYLHQPDSWHNWISTSKLLNVMKYFTLTTASERFPQHKNNLAWWKCADLKSYEGRGQTHQGQSITALLTHHNKIRGPWITHLKCIDKIPLPELCKWKTDPHVCREYGTGHI